MTDTSALISWSEPVASVDGITMFYGLSSVPSDKTSVEMSPPDKQYSIDGLRPDTEYKVSLISSSGDVTSDPVTTTFTTGILVKAINGEFTLYLFYPGNMAKMYEKPIRDIQE